MNSVKWTISEPKPAVHPGRVADGEIDNWRLWCKEYPNKHHLTADYCDKVLNVMITVFRYDLDFEGAMALDADLPEIWRLGIAALAAKRAAEGAAS